MTSSGPGDCSPLLAEQYRQPRISQQGLARGPQHEVIGRRMTKSPGRNHVGTSLKGAIHQDIRDGLAGAVAEQLESYFSAHKDGVPPTGLYDRVLHEVERPLITMTLDATKGNQIKAAAVLGLNRNTLRKKIRVLDIPVSRKKQRGE